MINKNEKYHIDYQIIIQMGFLVYLMEILIGMHLMCYALRIHINQQIWKLFLHI